MTRYVTPSTGCAVATLVEELLEHEKMGTAMSVAEFEALSAPAVADLISNSTFSEYRQACIDFGIDGNMLTRLPSDQLTHALGRAGVDNNQHLLLLLAEIENVRKELHSKEAKPTHTAIHLTRREDT